MVHPNFLNGVMTWLGSAGVLIGLLLATVLALGAIFHYVGNSKADEFLFGESPEDDSPDAP